MKQFAIQVIALTLVIVGALAFQTGKLPFLPQSTQIIKPVEKPLEKTEVLIKGKTIKVEIADTPEKRSKGLGGSQPLATDSGMLFTFPKADTYTFWMKGLTYPLDMIWIREGKVIDITRSAPPGSGVADQALPRYSPKEPSDMVLEVLGGFADSNNIGVGDTIEIR